MSKRLLNRQAISALICAGKSTTEVAADLRVTRTTVYQVKKQMESADLDQEPILGVKFGARSQPVANPRTRAAVKRRILAAPTKSLRQVAQAAGLHRETVRKVVRQEGWRSRRCIKVPLISAEGRQTRALRAQGLVNALKSLASGTIIFFPDEKKLCRRPGVQPSK